MAFTLIATGTLTPSGTNTLTGLALADVNGDGKADLVAAYTGANGVGTIAVMLDTGSSFAAPVTYALSSAPLAVTIGTVTAGTSADIVVTEAGSDMQVLAGNGSGGFTVGPASFTPLGTATQVLAANVTGSGRSTVSVYFANGIGESAVDNTSFVFSAPFQFNINPGTVTVQYVSGPVASADLNGDGRADLVVPTATGVVIGWGGAGGNFTTPTVLNGTTTILTGSGGVALADMNGDGKLDIVAAAPYGVNIFYNLGGGSFSAATYYSLTPYSSAGVVSVADLNGDGHPDLMLDVAGEVFVALGQATGGFVVVQTLAGDGPATMVLTGDISADTHPDVVVGSAAGAVTYVSATQDTAAQAVSAWAASGSAIGDTAILDSAANLTAQLTGLAPLAAAGLLIQVTLTDSAPALALTASQLTAGLGVLTTLASPVTLAVSGSFTVVQAAAAIAALPTLVTVSGGLQVVDSAAAVAAALGTLQGELSRIGGIAFTDAGTPTLSITTSQLLADQAALAKIITGAPYALSVSGTLTAAQALAVPASLLLHLSGGLAVADSAADIAASLVSLQALVGAGEIAAITLTDSTTPAIPLAASTLVAGQQTLLAIGSAFTLAVTGALTAAQAASLPAALAAKVSGGLQVTDSTADVAAWFAGLAANLADIAAITLTGTPTLTLTGAQLASAGVLGKIAGSYAVTVSGSVTAAQAAAYPTGKLALLSAGLTVADSAADIAANLAALQTIAAAARLAGITVTDAAIPTITLAASQASADATALAAITSPVHLAVQQALAANVASLAAQANVASIAVLDSAADVATNLAALQTQAAAGKLAAIAFTDSGTPGLSLTAAALVADLAALAVAGGSYAVTLTGSATVTVPAASLPMAVPVLAHISGSWTLVVSGSVTAALAASLTTAVAGHLSAPLAVSDSAANLVANLAALQSLAASGKLGTVSLTSGSQLSVTAAQLAADPTVLADLASGETVAVNGVAAAAASADAAAARVASVAVDDSAADVVANLAALTTLAQQGRLAGITLTDATTPTITLSAANWTAYAPALALIVSPYNVAGVVAELAALPLPGNVVAVTDTTGDGIADVITASGAVYAGRGGGAYATTAIALALPFSPTALLATDINGDGKADLVGVLGGAGLIGVAPGLGGGRYGPVAFTVLAGPISQIVAASVSASGPAELAAIVAGSFVVVLDGGTSLTPAVTLTPGGSVTSVALADVNGDGIDDLVVGTSRGVVVYDGTAGGGFTLAGTWLAGISIASLALGDVNGDGLPDIVAGIVVAGIATGGTATSAVEVLLNTGSSFAAPAGYVPVAAGIAASATVAIGDPAGSGGPDVVAQVVSGGSASQLVVLQGNATGSFSQGLQVALPTAAPMQLVNAGGNANRLDVLAGGTLYALGELSTSAALAVAQAAALPGPVAIVDTSADILASLAGLQIIAAAGELAGITLTDASTPTLTVTYAQYTADQQVFAAIQSAFTLTVTGVALANLASLAADARVGAIAVSDTAANLTAGLASPASLLADAARISGITVSDGGTISLAAALYPTDLPLFGKLRGNSTVLLTGVLGAAQNVTGAVLSWSLPFAAADTVHASLTADTTFSTGSSSLTQSGTMATYVPGLIAAANAGSDAVTWQVADSTVASTITFGMTIALNAGPAPAFVAVAGSPVVRNGASVVLGSVTPLFGDALRLTLLGDAAFPTGGSTISLSGGQLVYTPGSITVANAGYDNLNILITDLVTGTETQVQEAVSLLGTVAPPYDFFGTGTADLALQTTNSVLAAWTLKGTALASSAYLPSPTGAWQIFGSGNIAGNGLADLVERNPSNGAIDVELMDGFNVLGTAVLGYPGTHWMPVALGDVTGSGFSDLVFQDTTGDVAVWLIQGAAMVASAVVGNPGNGWDVVGTGNWAGTGKAGILLQNANSGSLEIWTMNGLSVTGTIDLPSPGGDWMVAGVGDLAGNGNSDIVFESGTGGIEVWMMTGTSVASTATLTPSLYGWKAIEVADVNGDGRADITMQGSNGVVVTWLMNATTIMSSGTVASPGTAWHLVGNRPMEFIAANAPGTYAPGGLETVFNVANPQSGGETITGFRTSWDTLVLSHSTFPSFAAVQAAATTVNGNAVIALGNGDNLTLSGLSASLLTSKNVLFQ